ncbi:MAG: DNA primase small subunit PriS [Nitrososphaerota archaeon]|jgi:DNA primase small subunit|uniref:DNA primase small subunit PriS n=1 Tax=Candidatus Bathycorpusculum sp. TaxID=2994959 RepID=UPI00282A827E|nr:DNA primase small subunit PriS [Candidatus Termitimicrobium sp.]MCL2431963.1 DNA primase small subunit PriS [Candidatus Termitimicrobium sp.]MDR0492045.1 DNA primase small subunit PriS [Nitrososphaerota archaeon]
MELDSREFVYQLFSEFYREPANAVPSPPLPHQREFGYLMFREKFMVRHRRFEQIANFRTVIANTVPSDVYHSCAYYDNPDFDMDKKGWIGSDVVFDIDADHIPTSCNKIHDEFRCVKCNFEGRGITPDICPCCGATKFETKIWACDLCIASARDEVAKLLDMLENDFGFSQDDVRVFFSGHRGYHIHLESEVIRSLDAMARKEIVDYVTGLGLSILEKNKETKGKNPRKKTSSKKFNLHDFGWNRRLKLGMQNFLETALPADLKEVGLKNKTLLDSKDTIIKRAINEGRWESIQGVKVQTWLKLAEHTRQEQAAKIDTVVTTDIHRLIRMNGTLHGKTGLKKVEFKPKELQIFDPFTEAVAFKKGKVKVLVFDAPEFRMSGETLGPYKNQTVELPTAAAVLLICKRRAEVAP